LIAAWIVSYGLPDDPSGAEFVLLELTYQFESSVRGSSVSNVRARDLSEVWRVRVFLAVKKTDNRRERLRDIGAAPWGSTSTIN
jgi:hypothetical protein